MQKTLSSTAKNADQMQHLVRENADLRDENSSLKRQLDWLKRQIFGRKSEKRLIQNPDQLDFGSCFEAPDLDKAPEPQTQQIAYTRKKQRKDTCVTDEGLRFDDSVPVEVIELKAPELEGETADQYEVIDYKITRRLAQRPGSYLVLEYRRPVVKH